jgi:hypothetical protein
LFGSSDEVAPPARPNAPISKAKPAAEAEEKSLFHKATFGIFD